MRLQALALINDCYKNIIDLTTNRVVITEAIEESNKDSHQLTYTLLPEATIEPYYLRMNDTVV